MSPVWSGLALGLFLVGLAVLARFNLWWPGILVLVGLASVVGSFASGRPWASLQSAIWLFGLAVLARFNLWWPGILVLVGISTLAGSIWRPGNEA